MSCSFRSAGILFTLRYEGPAFFVFVSSFLFPRFRCAEFLVETPGESAPLR